MNHDRLLTILFFCNIIEVTLYRHFYNLHQEEGAGMDTVETTRTFKAFRPSLFGEGVSEEEENRADRERRMAAYARRVEEGKPLFPEEDLG